MGISSEDYNILEYNQYQIYDKAPSIFYKDLGFVIRKASCKNNPKKSSKKRKLNKFH